MKKCILFAGPIGCSKTPVAVFLSWNLGLPLFNTDAIRSEVTEEKLRYVPEDKEYLRRRNERLDKLIKTGKDFILDASIDRNWQGVTQKLKEEGYRFFIISYDITEKYWHEMFVAKDYQKPDEDLHKIYQDHQRFVLENKKRIDLTITDENFNNRLSIALKAVENFLAF